ncbi:MAG: class I SAM-dependent methyltransferase [Acidithiobacillus sp.]
MNKNLRDLYGVHQGKVSDKWSLYLDEYERIFSHYRDLPIRLLEIGIQNGGSLEIWGEYFPKAMMLVGVDINLSCRALKYDDPRISVVVGDANSNESRTEILTKSIDFDLIIDDGSHKSSDIVKTFAYYFPFLADGGIFVAEDLHCSYWREFEGGLYDPYSSLSFFKHLADIVGQEHWGVSKASSEVLSGFSKYYDISFNSTSLEHIHSVEFVNSMCIVRKLPTDYNCLGKRVIVGDEAEVDAEVLKVNKTLIEPPSQYDNNWTKLAVDPAEEYLALRSELMLEIEQNAAIKAELAKILTSRSWRSTAILRNIAALLRKLF